MVKRKSNIVLMAIASGSVSTEVVRKLYIGVAPVYVVGVNPDKAEIEKLYNTTLDNEPDYLSTTSVGPEGNKKEAAQVRIDFILKTDKVKCDGVEALSKITFFLTDAIKYNKDNTKVQVIDKYGNTAWPTIEEAKQHAVILKKADGSTYNPHIDKDYRPAYIGEAELTDFIKNYLNIPNVLKWKDGQVVGYIDNPSDAEARLDKIGSYFKGDFTELRSVIKLQPNNRVKVMFGVRTTDDNKQYQAVYNQMTLKLGVNDYSRLDADLQTRKSKGAYPTTEFSIEPFHEYVVTPTDFSQNDPLGVNTAPSDNPWDNWDK